MKIMKIENLSKTAIKDLAATYAKKLINSGETSPLKALINLKGMQEYLKAFESVLRPAAGDEFDREYAKQDNIIDGASVKTMLRTSYTYNDEKLDELNTRLTQIKKEIKEREAFLRSIKAEQVDAETGEIAKPARIKESKSIIAITLPK